MQAVFRQTGLENEAVSTPSPSAFGAMASFLVPKLSAGLAGSLANEKSSISLDQSKILKKERHAVRPPVKHDWSLPGSSTDVKDPQIFQHELLQNFSINMFCKVTTFVIVLNFDFYFILFFHNKRAPCEDVLILLVRVLVDWSLLCTIQLFHLQNFLMAGVKK